MSVELKAMCTKVFFLCSILCRDYTHVADMSRVALVMRGNTTYCGPVLGLQLGSPVSGVTNLGCLIEIYWRIRC